MHTHADMFYMKVCAYDQTHKQYAAVLHPKLTHKKLRNVRLFSNLYRQKFYQQAKTQECQSLGGNNIGLSVKT